MKIHLVSDDGELLCTYLVHTDGHSHSSLYVDASYEIAIRYILRHTYQASINLGGEIINDILKLYKQGIK